MTGSLKMGVNVAAHTRHIFLGSAPRVKATKKSFYGRTDQAGSVGRSVGEKVTPKT